MGKQDHTSIKIYTIYAEPSYIDTWKNNDTVGWYNQLEYRIYFGSLLGIYGII